MIAGATEMAAEIAGRSPVAVQGTKINLVYSRDHSVAEGLDYMVALAAENPPNYQNTESPILFQASWNMSMLQTEDVITSAQAAMEKKSPKTLAFSKL